MSGYPQEVEAAAKRIGAESALKAWSYVEMSQACDDLARIEADARLVRRALIREMNRVGDPR